MIGLVRFIHSLPRIPGAWPALALALLLILTPGAGWAKSDDHDDRHSEFYGLVQERPETGLQGVWVIGGQTLTTDRHTEFDQVEGPLQVGGCAKVHLRNGRVHEIDSEPLRDCR